MLISIEHQWKRSQENAFLELTQEEKLMRTQTNVMNQLTKALATSIDISREPTYVQMDFAFNATVNNTDPDERHLFHVLNNVQKFKEFVTLYGENELALDTLSLTTIHLENYLINSSHSIQYQVEPYGFEYNWYFDNGLSDDRLVISKAGAAGDQVGVYITGPGTNFRTASCCVAANLTFDQKGNVTVLWAPNIVLDFSKIDPTIAGVMRITTSIRLPPTNERIKIRARGVNLNITHMHTSIQGDTVFVG
jgi:hypothetical protein